MTINPIMSHTPSLDMAAKTQKQVSDKVREMESQKAAEADKEKDINSKASEPSATFEKSGEDSASHVTGIYRMGEDKNGTPKVMYDKPKQAEQSAEEPPKCTTNTDKVDAEIKKLKQEKQEVQRQLQTEEDADKRSKLEQRLKNLESELQTKDNDAYRKQNSSYSFD